MPSRPVRPAASPIAVTVPTVSKKSTSTSENSSGRSRQSSAARTSAWNTVSKRGHATMVPFHAMWPVCIARSADTAIAPSIAPARPSASRQAPATRPTNAISGPGADQSPARHRRQRQPGMLRQRRHRRRRHDHDLRLDETEEDDEQADAGADGPAQIDGDGAGHGFAQPEQDAGQDDERRRGR